MAVQTIDDLQLPRTRPFDPLETGEGGLTYNPLMDVGEENPMAIRVVDLTSGLPLHKVYFRNRTGGPAEVTIHIVGSLEVALYFQDDATGLKNEVFTVPNGRVKEWIPDGLFVQPSIRTAGEGEENEGQPVPNENGGTILITSDKLIEVSPVSLWTPSLGS